MRVYPAELLKIQQQHDIILVTGQRFLRDAGLFSNMPDMIQPQEQAHYLVLFFCKIYGRLPVFLAPGQYPTEFRHAGITGHKNPPAFRKQPSDTKRRQDDDPGGLQTFQTVSQRTVKDIILQGVNHQHRIAVLVLTDILFLAYMDTAFCP